MLESATGEAGSALLTLASALLFEELTLGGLVRLILAPKTTAGTENHHVHEGEDDRQPTSGRATSRPS